MKKLFTSLLLLGAVTVTQAQVTVTDYNDGTKTVTINFTYNGARPTPKMVEDAIKDAFEGDPKNQIDPTVIHLPKPEREKVKTIVLTGHWNNVDIHSTNHNPGQFSNLGNSSIAAIVGEFCKKDGPEADRNYPTLDLSQCTGFESKFVSIQDYQFKGGQNGERRDISATGWADGYEADWLESDIIALPELRDGSSTTETLYIDVDVVPHSEKVQVNFSYKLYGEVLNFDFENADKTQNHPYPFQGNNSTYIQYDGNDGKWYMVWPAASQNENDRREEISLAPSSYTYFDGYQEQTIQYIDYRWRKDGDDYYYDYTTYDYTDENNVAHSDLNTNNLVEVDGVYKYKYQVTTVVEPVLNFIISKDLPIGGIIFPVSDNFDFIPDNSFETHETLKKAVLGENIVAIGNHAFEGAQKLEEINFPSSLTEIGHQAFKKTNLKKALMAGSHVTKIRHETFELCHSLTKATFPTTLIEIQKEAFDQCALDTVDLSKCHELRMLAQNCFQNMQANNDYTLLYVKLCSHPKRIKGNQAGKEMTEDELNNNDSQGAFHLNLKIKKVEIVGCEGTCATQCICENRGFEWDITHYQTAAPADVYDRVAELIYPKDLPVCEGDDYANPYTSSFDFFEGDYKVGVKIGQEALLCYYRYCPNIGEGDAKSKVMGYDEAGHYGLIDQWKHVNVDDRYLGNGWHEFIKTGTTQVVTKGEFLRTYSRTEGDGPCILPEEITAYRAVDYVSKTLDYVADKKNGKYVCLDETKPLNEREYVKITDLTQDQIDNLVPNTPVATRTHYSQLTIGGILYLRPLRAKKAEYSGIEGGYTDENKAQFDSEAIYSQLKNVENDLSYVPENTGVVLHSKSLLEDAFLLLPGDFGTETVYKEFHHTGDRYEESRRIGGNGVNTDDDINMLSGSYGEGVPVAPVFPWKWNGNPDYTDGHYTGTKAFRNFALVVTTAGTKDDNGNYITPNVYGWKRLQPSLMKHNRAFAQIPVGRFDNFNETASQLPDFTETDMPNDAHSNVIGEGVTGGSNNLMLIGIFEDETNNAGAEVDGIKTVNTVEVKADSDGWYTIQGIKVAQPTKGVYIHNGKKVVIK